MNPKSTNSLDILVKRIYSFYIDIKSGDFKEIDKDILLNDISSLYISIKELYPTHTHELADLEKEILSNKTQLIKDASLITKDDKSEYLTDEPKLETINPIEKIDSQEIIKKEIDLTLFMEEDDLSEVKMVNPTLDASIKSDNTSSPVIRDILNTEPPKDITSFSKIPTIEEKENTIKNEPKIIESVIEPDKKSANKIMDFLHDDDKVERKDIYSFLDINTRIGLVELFFKGNSLELTECLVKVNSLKSKIECIEVIDKYAQQFDVKKTDDIYQSFIQLVDRKFQFSN